MKLHNNWIAGSLCLALSMVLAFFLAVLWAFVRHALQSVGDDPKQVARLVELKRAIGVRVW